MSKGRVMGFVKGQSGNPRGRKKGVPNKATLEIRAFARSVLESPKYRALMLKRAQKADLTNTETQLLHFYAYGRPRFEIQMEQSLTPQQAGAAAWAAILKELPKDVREALVDAAKRAQAKQV